MLNFSKPIKLVNSILGLDSNKLRNLFSDPKGSHLADAFMKSAAIGEKSRDSLVKCLQVNHLLLQVDIYSSFLVRIVSFRANWFRSLALSVVPEHLMHFGHILLKGRKNKSLEN